MNGKIVSMIESIGTMTRRFSVAGIIILTIMTAISLLTLIDDSYEMFAGLFGLSVAMLGLLLWILFYFSSKSTLRFIQSNDAGDFIRAMKRLRIAFYIIGTCAALSLIYHIVLSIVISTSMVN